MEGEGDKIKSKQASKRDRTLQMFSYLSKGGWQIRFDRFIDDLS